MRRDSRSERSTSAGPRSRRASRSSAPRSPTAYAGRVPLLVAPLKSSAVFLADLSRALPLAHELDVIELAPVRRAVAQAAACACSRISMSPLDGRDVLLVEDVVDTGLTLGLPRRAASSSAARRASPAVTLLDRPYRRLVDDIPLDYVGFTVPDELFGRLRPRPRPSRGGRGQPGSSPPTSTSCSPTSCPPRSTPRESAAGRRRRGRALEVPERTPRRCR